MSQVSERWPIPFFLFLFLSPSHPTFQMFPWPLFCLFCPSFTFVLCPVNSFSFSPLFFCGGGLSLSHSSSPFILHISPPSDTWVCSPASFLALLHQQAQPASQQWATGCPSQQRPATCDAYTRLPGRSWLPNDDDPGATIALPKLTTGTCVLHTRTGRGHRYVQVQVVMLLDFRLTYYSYFGLLSNNNNSCCFLLSFLSIGQQLTWPHPSNTQSQQARASTQAPVLLNMVLTVRGST